MRPLSRREVLRRLSTGSAVVVVAQVAADAHIDPLPIDDDESGGILDRHSSRELEGMVRELFGDDGWRRLRNRCTREMQRRRKRRRRERRDDEVLYRGPIDDPLDGITWRDVAASRRSVRIGENDAEARVMGCLIPSGSRWLVDHRVVEGTEHYAFGEVLRTIRGDVRVHIWPGPRYGDTARKGDESFFAHDLSDRDRWLEERHR